MHAAATWMLSALVLCALALSALVLNALVLSALMLLMPSALVLSLSKASRAVDSHR